MFLEQASVIQKLTIVERKMVYYCPTGAASWGGRGTKAPLKKRRKGKKGREGKEKEKKEEKERRKSNNVKISGVFHIVSLKMRPPRFLPPPPNGLLVQY